MGKSENLLCIYTNVIHICVCDVVEVLAPVAQMAAAHEGGVRILGQGLRQGQLGFKGWDDLVLSGSRARAELMIRLRDY